MNPSSVATDPNSAMLGGPFGVVSARSGFITPTCITVDPGDNMTPPTKICGLDCPNAKDGCPDNESCMMVTTGVGPAMRCEYN